MEKMTRVYLEDQGQDVVMFDFDEGKFLPRIQNPKPLTADLSSEDYIVNAVSLKVGEHVQFSNAEEQHFFFIKYPITKIERLY